MATKREKEVAQQRKRVDTIFASNFKHYNVDQMYVAFERIKYLGAVF